MRYVKYLIDQVRRETENEDQTSFTGIKDSEFLQYLNDAQHRLQSLITAHHPRVFIEETKIDIVSGQESYDLPTDIFLENKVHKVEYSSTGDLDDYYILEEADYSIRSSGSTGSPANYIRMSGKILLSPVPTSGKLRINYIKRIRELDLRQMEFESGGYATDTGVLTFKDISEIDSLSEHDYLCIVDRDGKKIHSNLSYSDLTNSKFTISTGLSSMSSGGFIVGGKDTTTHSDLPRNCERYLIAYCAWKIFKRDSSMDSGDQQTELSAMEQDIVDSYKVITDDVQYVPQLNPWGDWFGEF